MILIFFFEQKTAYELRISDWSSYVCSSDLWQCRTACRQSCGGTEGLCSRQDAKNAKKSISVLVEAFVVRDGIANNIYAVRSSLFFPSRSWQLGGLPTSHPSPPPPSSGSQSCSALPPPPPVPAHLHRSGPLAEATR